MNIRALVQLWNCTQMHPGTSGARAAVGVLLGLYNGPRFRFDLTDLRLMDATDLPAAMAVIQADASHCQKEVHDWLNDLTGRHDFGMRFEHLAYQYRLKGRCRRESLSPLSPERMVIPQTPTQTAVPA